MIKRHVYYTLASVVSKIANADSYYFWRFGWFKVDLYRWRMESKSQPRSWFRDGTSGMMKTQNDRAIDMRLDRCRPSIIHIFEKDEELSDISPTQ